MREEAAFLRHLHRRPDDLDALLVYADWLDDNGDEARAAFLRLQRQILDMRPPHRGLVGQSRQLLKLARRLPAEWLAVVSRPRLVGTCWVGTDSEGDSKVFRFLKGGVLNYTLSSDRTYQNGTWAQVGNVVTMETNRHYADYEGFVAGDRITGTAYNITGRRWRWGVTRTTDPELCDPGDPDTTVYEHPSQPPTPARRRPRRRPAR
jgi:uncharacterized protein (TIGR02996 family)